MGIFENPPSAFDCSNHLFEARSSGLLNRKSFGLHAIAVQDVCLETTQQSFLGQLFDLSQILKYLPLHANAYKHSSLSFWTEL
jgi:hypothetical protein